MSAFCSRAIFDVNGVDFRNTKSDGIIWSFRSFSLSDVRCRHLWKICSIRYERPAFMTKLIKLCKMSEQYRTVVWLYNTGHHMQRYFHWVIKMTVWTYYVNTKTLVRSYRGVWWILLFWHKGIRFMFDDLNISFVMLSRQCRTVPYLPKQLAYLDYSIHFMCVRFVDYGFVLQVTLSLQSPVLVLLSWKTINRIIKMWPQYNVEFLKKSEGDSNARLLHKHYIVMMWYLCISLPI